MITWSFFAVSLWGRVAGFSLSSDQTVTVGDPVSMNCKTDFDTSVIWRFTSTPGVSDTIFESGTLINGYKKSYRMDTGVTREYRLTISKVELSHAGIYECTERGGVGPGGASLTLTVRRKPFSVSPTFSSVKAGQKTVLKCVTGLDKSVDWHFHKLTARPLVSSAGMILNGFKKAFKLDAPGDGEFSLVLERAAVDNSGEYECIEGDGIGPGRGTVTLAVDLRISKQQKVEVGDNAVLACATGQNGTVTWRFKPSGENDIGFIVIRPEDDVRFKQILAPAAGEHRLVVSKAQVDDDGLYECADNSGSGKRATVELKVVKQEMNVEKDSKVGERVRLDCPVEPLAAAEVTYCSSVDVSAQCCVLYWQGAGNPDCNSRVEIVSADGKSYVTVHNFSRNDEGHYYCSNDDGFGERVAVSRLKVVIADDNNNILMATSSNDLTTAIERKVSAVVLLIVVICVVASIALFVAGGFVIARARCLRLHHLAGRTKDTAAAEKKPLAPPPVIVNGDKKTCVLEVEGPANQTEFVRTMDMPSAVCGLAQMENRLYAVCRNKTVYVCDTSRMDKPLQTIEIPDLENPCDLTMYQAGRELYIADNTHDDKSSCIWKIALMSNNQIAKFKEFQFQLVSIAATSTGLLVTKAKLAGERLLRLGWNGEVIPVNLPYDVCPTHVFEASDGALIVCHKSTHSEGAVYRFAANPEKMYRYVPANAPHLFDPCYATLAYGDIILVVDAVGRQIFAVNWRLEPRDVLLDGRNMKMNHIRKMCFNERSGQLFVGHDNGAVSVFKLPLANENFVP